VDDVARCLLLSLPGRELDSELLSLVENGLGGVILFGANIGEPSELRRLTDRLREARSDVIVAVDEEGGDVTRLEYREGSSLPGNLALGAVDDIELTRACGAAIGARLAAVGVSLDLAPVADANTNPANPVIGTRSFGADPNRVAAHVAAFVDGLQGEGVAACAKHFPGHGATAEDSHTSLPTDNASLEEIDGIYLPPFIAAIDSSVKAVMTAHVVYPALDHAPATLSRAILVDLLRDRLGFSGVIVSDALGMAAIAEHEGVVGGAVAALASGVDLVCVDAPRDVQLAVLAACREACATGSLDPREIARSASRVEELGRGFLPRPLSLEPDDSAVGLGLGIARRSLGVEIDGLPLLDSAYVIDTTGARGGEDRTTRRLAAALGELGVTWPGCVATDPAVALEAALAVPADQPVVLVVREAYRDHGRSELVRAVIAARPDAVIVSTGMPGDGELAPGRVVSTLGSARPNLIAAAEALTGKRR